MKKSELIFTAVLVPLDFLMLLGAGLAGYFLRTSSWVAQYRPVLFHLNLPLGKYFVLTLGVSLFLLIVFALVGLYRIKPSRPLLDDFLKIVIGVSAGMMVLVFYIFLRQELFNSRFLVLAGWLMAILFVFFGRWLANAWQKYLVRKYHFGANRVLVVGRDGVSRRISQYIKSQPGLGYQLVSHLIEPDVQEIKTKIDNPGVEEVILADPDWPREKILELVDFCEEKHLAFKFVPNLFQTLTVNSQADTLGTVPVIEIRRTALDGWGKIIKRLVDIVGSLVGIIIFSPIMALAALVIKWDSFGPIIYRNERVSPKGNFDTYKFRSMKFEYCVGRNYPHTQVADIYEDELVRERSVRQGPVHKIIDDPRRTRVGKFLEKTSLDELPQFFNVLKGEMSLVGPRPHMPKEVAKYEKHHKKVFNIKPGITGLAQISGRSDLDFDEEVELDTFYIENWSLKLDSLILLKTPLVVLFKRHSQ